MKITIQLIVLAGLGLFASAANADLIELGETGSAVNPGANAGLACDAFASTYGAEYCSLTFDFKHDYPSCPKEDEDGYDPDCMPNVGGAGTGAVSGGDYIVGDYLGEPASSLVSWDLLDPAGYGVFAIAVKTGTIINWYGFDPDDADTDALRVFATDLQVFTHASEDRDSISHISFFVRQFDGGNGGDCLPGDPGYPDCDPVTPVPEPGSLGLLGLGLLVLSLGRRRRG